MHKLAAAGEALVPVAASSATRRPQAGRYRQFWQVGAEAIGSDDPAVDAEADRCCCTTLLGELGVRGAAPAPGLARHAATRAPSTASELHGLPARARGPSSARRGARPHRPQPAARVRRQAPAARSEVMARRAAAARPRSAPRTASTSTRSARCSTRAGVAYEVDPTLVRGLDYYTRTMFEFTSDALGAQTRRRRRRALRRPDRAARRPADARHGLGRRASSGCCWPPSERPPRRAGRRPLRRLRGPRRARRPSRSPPRRARAGLARAAGARPGAR